MTQFLIVAVAGTILVALVLVWPLITGSARARGRDAADAALYRDQLSELERDVARGTISESEAEGARAEVARRLIAATKRAESAEALSPAPAPVSRLTAAIALVAAPALTALLYIQVGAPGTPDQPLSERRAAQDRMPSQEVAERMTADRRPAPPALDPQDAELLERLKKIVAEQPMDIRGRRFLASTLASTGQWVEARKAYDGLVGVLGENAKADDYANQAEAMIYAAAGYVSPRAIAALETALKMDPAQTMARYYAGFALRQSGRPQEAVALWRTLLQEDQAAAEPRGAEWQTALRTLIDETAGKPSPGPTREDMKAAEEMTAEERQAMIAGMVARLEERLTTDGGEAEEWVRLISAYIQLDKTEDARRIFDLSQEKIGEPTARAFVRERALVMGLQLEGAAE